MRKITELKESQDIALTLLLYLDEVCLENNLTYFAADGTLLGLIRHQGFIPWDDDVDVWMPREDYEKLEKIVNSDSGNPYTPGPQPELLNRYEGVNVMVEDIIHAVTDEYLSRFGVPAERLTSAERQKIVQELDRRGVFLVKGSIVEVARRLGCSEVTIYRYLQ